MSTDALNKVVATLEKAKEKLSKPKPGDEENPGKKPWENMKADGKLRGVAERLLSMANQLKETGKPPGGPAMRKLRALHNEMGAALDAYPSPKRAVKSVSMTPDEFTDHAATEIERAVEDQDVERLEQIQVGVESVAYQMNNSEVEKIRVDVFEDPAQQKREESGGEVGVDMLKSIGEKINELSEVIQSMKAKKPKDKPDEMTDGKKPKPGEEEMGKAKKPKPGEEEEVGKQEAECPSCGAMNKADADACKACGAKLKKSGTKKADDDEKPTWPSDMNSGRKLNEAESWGRVRKSLGDEDRDFGPDPDACRE